MKVLSKRYRATVVVFVSLTLPLFLLYLHGKDRSDETFVETGLMNVTGPAQRLMSGAVEGVMGVWSDYAALVNVKRESRDLSEQITRLEGQALENRQLRQENERLKGLCEFRHARGDLRTVAAHVVSKDVSPYYRVVRIVLDVGEEDRVSEGMPVITHRGVVGTVSRVTGRYADVMLSVDPRSRIDVRIVARGVSGTLEGRGDQNLFGARFFFLHEGEPIAQKDEVVTSGHDRVFPAGFIVGYIASDKARQDGVYFEYDVTPAVNFATLEEVLVVLNEQESLPDFGRGKTRRR